MNIHKKDVTVWLINLMNIRLKTYYAKQNIILKTLRAKTYFEQPEWRHLLCEH